MTEELFLERMSDILDAEDEIKMDTVLDELEEWDSLSVIAYMGLANSVSEHKVNASMVRQAETMGDLYKIIS